MAVCLRVPYSDLKSSRDALLDAGRLSTGADDHHPPVLEVRVYRRSTETLAMLDDRRRAQSLPRGMELNRSVGSDLHGADTTASSRRDSISAASRATSRRGASARSSVTSITAFKGRCDLPVIYDTVTCSVLPVHRDITLCEHVGFRLYETADRLPGQKFVKFNNLLQ